MPVNPEFNSQGSGGNVAASHDADYLITGKQLGKKDKLVTVGCLQLTGFLNVGQKTGFFLFCAEKAILLGGQHWTLRI
jgi:hypothetical protein